MLKLELNEYIDNKLVHSIHNSGAKSFQSCRRRWDWIYKGHYYPTVTAKPLEFGVAFHAAMEKLYDPMTWHDKQLAKSLTLGTFVQTIDQQHITFRKKNPELVNQEVSDDYKERTELGVGMLKYYFEVSDMYDVGLKPVKVEVAFEVPLKGPKGETLWCKCATCIRRWNSWVLKDQEIKVPVDRIGDELEVNYFQSGGGLLVDPTDPVDIAKWKGLPVTFGGRIDCLMIDEQGRYWIYDWKTAAMLTGNHDFLQIDSQITSYCWALWSLGINIAGFIYAEIKKAIPEEPEPHKGGRRYKGLLYSVNRQINTTYDMYKKTVMENDPSAYHGGLYNDFLDYLKSPDGPKYHQRFQLKRNKTEMINAGNDLYNLALDMTDPNIRIYPAPGKFNCQTCAFFEPCLGKNRGEDYEYTLDTLYDKRERHYYDEPKSTDKRGGE